MKVSQVSFSFICVLLVSIFFLTSFWSDYSFQKSRVSPKLFDIVIKNKICSSIQDCINKEVFLGSGRGSAVRYYFYGITDQGVIDKIINCIVEEKKLLNDDTPFYVRFYAHSHHQIMQGSSKKVIYQGYL